MCKIGLGVTFRVGNRRKPLKNFEQVKCFLFVCLFRLCAFCASEGEQHNTYNENYCFRFLHDGYDYNHLVDNSASLQNPRIKFNTFQKPIESGISSIVQYLFSSVIALLFWLCKKVSKPQNHESFDWFITSCKKAIQKCLGFWIPRCRFQIPFQWNFDSKFQY